MHIALSELRIAVELTITKIISLYYFEFDKYQNVAAESHSSWEFVYVDKGGMTVVADDDVFELRQGDLIFYKPNSVHCLHSINETPPNVIVLAFQCKSPSMHDFGNKPIHLLDHERDMLARILKEGLSAYSPLPNPEMSFNKYIHIKRKPNQPFGSEQLMKNYLEILLIYLIRRKGSAKNQHVSSLSMDNKKDELFKEFLNYFNQTPDWNIKNEDLCRKLCINGNLLKTVIKEKTGCNIREYINKLRFEMAKTMMREHAFNFSQISELLGYNSVHYFSRHFKQMSNMTPSEYSRSAMSRAVE